MESTKEQINKPNKNKSNMDFCMYICFPCLFLFACTEECLKTNCCLICCCTNIHSNKSKEKISQENSKFFDFSNEKNKEMIQQS